MAGNVHSMDGSSVATLRAGTPLLSAEELSELADALPRTALISTVSGLARRCLSPRDPNANRNDLLLSRLILDRLLGGLEPLEGGGSIEPSGALVSSWNVVMDGDQPVGVYRLL